MKNWILSAALAATFLGYFVNIFQICSEEGMFFEGGFLSGMVRMWNSIADTLGRTEYILLPKYGGEGEGIGLFLLVLAAALTLLAYAILRSAQAWLFLIFAVPFFAVQVLFDLKPPLIWAACFLCVLSAAVLSCISAGGGSAGLAMFIPVVIAAAFAVTCLAAGDGWQRPSAIAALDEKAGEKIQDIRYGENPKGDGSFQLREAGDHTALEVRMVDPQPLYLRGFVGSVYRQGRWEVLNTQDYYNENDLYYWLHKNGFSGLTQIADGARISGETEQNEVTVKNLSVSKKYIYLPYETASCAEQGVKKWNDSFVTAGGLRGISEYTFTSAPAMVQDWPELAAEMYLQKRDPRYTDYFLNESYYNVDNYTYYAQITDAQKAMAEETLGARGEQTREHLDYKEAIRKIRAFLEGECVYTENVKESSDPVAQFLRDKKGSDVHFASAATLLFRYYGIPARYVEGYLITPRDVEGRAPGEAISVPESNNHAWTEIYIDGFGWVPLEVTPEYYEVMPQPDLTKGLENVNTGHTPLTDAQKQKNSSIRETNTANWDRRDQIPWKLIFCIILAVIAALALVRLFRRLFRSWTAARRREKIFHGPDIRLAVCAIYEYMRDMSVSPGSAARRIGNLAAYSLHPVSEEDRRSMLEELQKMRREQRETDRKNRRGIGRMPRTVVRRMRR